MTILVTGGAGFIGSNFICDRVKNHDEKIVNFDKLTYSGNLNNLVSIEQSDNYVFVKGDIANAHQVKSVLSEYKPRAIINFAAESHVDRSIEDAEAFIQTNILGTFRLLECTKDYWQYLSGKEKDAFRFVHISTDEVYGSLKPNEPGFTEQNRYIPNSPYSASKAASDHLVRAYFKTYGLPVMTTNCSNNYGPFQFPEKLVPLIILNSIYHKDLPIYGDGLQVRDWLFVDDHCKAISAVLERGQCGEVYNIGGLNEKTNIEIVHTICDILEDLRPLTSKNGINHYRDLIKYVDDRPGHDRRYAIDATKISTALNWTPSETFETGIKKTVQWYLENMDWVEQITKGEYRDWIERQYK